MSTVSENLRKQFAKYQAAEADKGNFVDQKDLAALLGLTPGFVSHLMTGKNLSPNRSTTACHHIWLQRS